MISNEISLMSLYTTLEDIKTSYGTKINYLSSVFDTRSRLPDGVSNDNDGPGLWPEAGVSIYKITEQQALSEAFCTTGLIVNIASQAQRMQMMLIEHNVLYPEKDGRIYTRYADTNTDTWTDWQLILRYQDLEYIMSSENSGFGHADSANFLTTPRLISIEGAISGGALFDGTEDIVINTVADGVVPLNIVHEATYHAIPTCLHLCTLPASAGDIHTHAIIFGHVGGWTKDQGQATIHLDIAQRDGISIHGLVLGKLNNVDVVAIQDSDTKELLVLLELKDYVGRCELSIYGDQIKIVNRYISRTPYIPLWRASEDAAYIDGTETNILPNGKVSSSEVADRVIPKEMSSGTTYVAMTNVNGDVLYNPAILVDNDEQAIIAKTFVGDLQGHAATADLASVAESVAMYNNNYIVAPLLGINAKRVYYDEYVYLMEHPGYLHASMYISDGAEITNINSTNIKTTKLEAQSILLSGLIRGDTAEFTTSVTAPLFIGDLFGNAKTATTADIAKTIMTTKNNTKQAPVVGIDDTTAIYDQNVYLTAKSGEIHAINFDGATATLSTSATAPKFIGNLQGNADTATLADKAMTVNVTSGATTRAVVVGHVGDNLYSDSGIYLTTKSGEIHATNFDGITATLSTSVTSPKFIGNLQGNSDTSTLSETAKKLITTVDNIRKISVVGVDGTTPYVDSGVYITTTSGQLRATSFDGVTATLSTSVTSPKFIGNLQGNADTATLATTANAINTTTSITTKALVVGVSGTKPYVDDNVYLTTASGGFHVLALETNTFSAQTGKLSASIPSLAFHYGMASSATSTLSATGTNMLKCSSDFTATRVYNAVWNDYAEWFPRGGESKPGDVIALDLTQTDEKYARAYDGCTTVVGVHSDEYGHIIGGEQPPTGADFYDYNIAKFIPLALAGRVRVNFTGPAKRGMKVVPAANGKARLIREDDDLSLAFGILVEDDMLTEDRRLKIKLF